MRRLIMAGVLLVTAALVVPAHADYGSSQGPAHSNAPVCAPPAADSARCHSRIETDNGGKPLATTSYVNGYAPSDLASAYSIPSGGAGQTVAIVDAYDNPYAETDLGVYRSRFGLPACTTANGCFRKVNQRGQAAPPSPNVSWGQEIALDLDMVSAVCPNCKILLVEADSNSFNNLAAAVDMAAAMGANAISNSYGGNEFSSEASFESHYKHPGSAITVSSGDSGYGAEFPAASQYVTAVGGTSLTRAPSAPRGWSETVWSGAGSGCSAYITKPSWQTDSGCGRRTVADVAAIADPNTGVAVYDSYGSSGGANWFVFGGTSVAAPIIAAVYAVAGNASSVNYGQYPYTHSGWLWDVTAGSNGRCVAGKRNTGAAYLCTGAVGFDGPTGLGTPAGVGAF